MISIDSFLHELQFEINSSIYPATHERKKMRLPIGNKKRRYGAITGWGWVKNQMSLLFSLLMSKSTFTIPLTRY